MQHVKHPLDIVIAGPDGSGTSTQLNWFMNYIRDVLKLKIKDLRGTEVDVLWHAAENPISNARDYESFAVFKAIMVELETHLNTESNKFTYAEIRQKVDMLATLRKDEATFLRWSADRIRGTPTQEPSLATMKDVPHGTFINPKNADVWILEEPPYRLSGLHNRFFEQQRSLFEAQDNQLAAAMAHSLYRESEYYRFRKEILAAGKLCIRSRSEESACYQLYDLKLNPTGPNEEQYLQLPGHDVAFAHAPTHIFIVHGPKSWTVQNMIDFAKQRMGNRLRDDYEKKPEYQLLINTRYATNWLELLYQKGCSMHKGVPPKFIRFDMTTPKETLQLQMTKIFAELLSSKK